MSRSAYQISWVVTEPYFVLAGWFSQMKNNKLPSAEMVGRNSGRSELILMPRFSILMMVLESITSSDFGFNFSPVSLLIYSSESLEVCPLAELIDNTLRKKGNSVFKAKDLGTVI